MKRKKAIATETRREAVDRNTDRRERRGEGLKREEILSCLK